MELDYNIFKSEFKEKHCIKTHEFTKRETKIRIGTWKDRNVVLKYCYKERESFVHSKLPYHPNIIEFIAIVHRLGNPLVKPKSKRNTRTYVLMEMGVVDLADTIYEGNLKESLDIMIDVTKGLHHLHSCGIIHHDIKMGNILLMNEGIYKICDFGASEFASVHGYGSNKYNARIAGAYGYLAPEQTIDSTVPISNKIDIYAVGMLGRKLLNKDEPTTTKIVDYLHIMACCCSLDPNDRYDVNELLVQLISLREKL